MRTAIISDLHLGTASGADLLADRQVQSILFEEITGADRVVLLGDLVELREHPLPEAADRAAPFLKALGEAAGDVEVVLVPGNHDHGLARQILERVGSTDADLGLEERGEVPQELADRVGRDHFSLAYPGIRVREDVYATHGHYLDCHMSLPTFEVLALAATLRATGGLPQRATPGDYERAGAGVYGFAEGFARAGGARRMGTNPTGRAYAALTRKRPGARATAIRMAAPLAVRAAGRVLRRRFHLDLSHTGIARSSLAAMHELTRRLAIKAEHVIFGHTHRPGPRKDPGGVEAGWQVEGGPALHNAGSWLYSPGLLAATAAESLFWPGSVIWVDSEGPPVRRDLLSDWDHAGLREVAARNKRMRLEPSGKSPKPG